MASGGLRHLFKRTKWGLVDGKLTKQKDLQVELAKIGQIGSKTVEETSLADKRLPLFDVATGKFIFVDLPNSASWGNIEGLLTDQADLVAEFLKKLDKTGGQLSDHLLLVAPEATGDGHRNNSPQLILRAEWDSDTTTGVFSQSHDIALRNYIADGDSRLEIIKNSGGRIISFLPYLEATEIPENGRLRFTNQHAANDDDGSLIIRDLWGKGLTIVGARSTAGANRAVSVFGDFYFGPDQNSYKHLQTELDRLEGLVSHKVYFEVNPDLATYPTLLMDGSATALAEVLGRGITSCTYDVRLLSTTTWTTGNTIAGVETWITNNAITTERWEIRAIPAFEAAHTGDTQVMIKFAN